GKKPQKFRALIIMSDNYAEDPKELYEKAGEFIEKSDFLKALDCLNKALEIDPNYAEAMSRLGYVHMRLEFKKLPMKEVFNLCKKAIELNPTSPVTWNTMGNVYYKKKEFMNWEKKGDKYRKKNRFEEAIGAYIEEIEQNPDNEKKLGRLWAKIAKTHKKKGENKQAIRAFYQVINLNPRSVSAVNSWNQIGILYYNTGCYPLAIEAYNKGLNIQPENLDILWNLSLVYDHSKHIEKLIEIYKNIIKLNPKYNKVWRKLGYYYNEFGEYDKALEAYEAYVKNYENRHKRFDDDYYHDVLLNIGIIYIPSPRKTNINL
ncbi:unnamed protein product, partial [marine sediment metagenome]